MRSSLKVITSAPSYDMTMLDTLKSELGITNTTNDIMLSKLITRASFIVAEITGRVWAKEAVEERFYISWGERVPALVLKRRPLVAASPTLITVDENGSALVENVDFFADYSAGILHRINGYVWTFSNNPSVVVQYTGGYELLDDLPYGLEEAVLILTKSFWAGKSVDPNVKSETTYELDSVTYRDAASDAQKIVRDMLSIYSEPSFG